MSFIRSIQVSNLILTTQEKNIWAMISPKVEDEKNVPAPRSGTHSLSFENSIFFFGGYTRKGGNYFNDLTEYKTL
jgi:hypothetical protein